MDVLILEGLKDSAYPKVEVVRRAVSEHTVCATEHLIAVATDVVTQDVVNCPVYDMNDIAGIYACILEILWYIREITMKLIENRRCSGTGAVP